MAKKFVDQKENLSFQKYKNSSDHQNKKFLHELILLYYLVKIIQMIF